MMTIPGFLANFEVIFNDRMSRKLKIIVPVIFWLILLTEHMIRSIPMLEGEQIKRYLITMSITTPLDLVSFLLFYALITPKLIKREKVYLYIGIIIIFWIAYGFVWAWVYHLRGFVTDRESFVLFYKMSFGHTLIHSVYGVIICFAIDWFEKFRKQKELKNYNKEMELALLRSQINPHFLFNTLNNINSFVYQDPDKTSYSIIKLSDIMRYMLYETNTDKVFLDKEVTYIHNYLDLQKLRSENKAYIDFQVKGDISRKKIAPMLFIPFVENAVKHGKKNIKNGISITLEVSEDTIIFTCVNRMKETNSVLTVNENGVGLANIKRRLELLYPDKHHLEITKDSDIFSVKLEINTLEK
jgi:hypothetical protein